MVAFGMCYKNSIFCVHGGLGPSLKSLKDISDIERPVISSRLEAEHSLPCDLT
eukprot:UN18100